MKFHRADLITRVQVAIDRRVQDAEKANSQSAERFAQLRDEYLSDTGPLWRTFLDNASAALDAGRPITTDDVPKRLLDGWGSRIEVKKPDFFTPPAPREPDVAALTTLLDLLQAATDDEISTSSLERMGFKTAQLFRSR